MEADHGTVLMANVADVRRPGRIKCRETSRLFSPRGDADAAHFGGNVLHSWVAFGEYDFIAVVDMPDNESMAAYVLAMTAKGHYSAGKTTVLLSGDESKAALNRAASLG